MPSVRIVGAGRAGTAMAIALGEVGWGVAPFPPRDADLSAAAEDVDLLLLATPDGVIHDVAGAIAPTTDTVVGHLAGSLGLDVLEPHPRRAAGPSARRAPRWPDRRAAAPVRCLVRGGR